MSAAATSIQAAKMALPAGAVITAITIEGPWQSPVPSGPLRLTGARLPGLPGATSHWVGVVAFADTDLTGWSVQWVSALTAGAWSDYHRFGAGLRIADGREGRIFGGLANGPGEPGVDTWFGGTVGQVPPEGAAFRLVDPTGAIAGEIAAMPSANDTPVNDLVLVPSGDGTRAFLMSPQALRPGRWTIGLTFLRDAGPALPQLSIGGIKDSESAALAFTVPPR